MGPHEVVPCQSTRVSISKCMRRFLERSSVGPISALCEPTNVNASLSGRQIQRHGPGALLYCRPIHNRLHLWATVLVMLPLKTNPTQRVGLWCANDSKDSV
ncbi:hypothetical protein FVEG_15141 [Fusarium verticillioides 7600]|uniref:Uncharacterized protein n=1 Tax=Gibberella moniliformis (strain M3125 / FGSC 7600) TaxID=334819 RepID=W7LPU0_GIBM7|nr:hypothetical protein FVEG_15141 [Fusarium verticillioides 7600]EWG40526.1 hypothetical protein FVEG_15141 [Fusarium verticillioides 7600]